jgi:hypothetical protein
MPYEPARNRVHPPRNPGISLTSATRRYAPRPVGHRTRLGRASDTVRLSDPRDEQLPSQWGEGEIDAFLPSFPRTQHVGSQLLEQVGLKSCMLAAVPRSTARTHTSAAHPRRLRRGHQAALSRPASARPSPAAPPSSSRSCSVSAASVCSHRQAAIGDKTARADRTAGAAAMRPNAASACAVARRTTRSGRGRDV